MEVSLFNLMTMPRRRATHRQVIEQARAMTRMADEAGFDIAWFAEHHLSNYSISPSPLMAAAAMAARTERIKLGPAVIVLPFYEPLRLAEDICYADQLSDGRLVLGFGTGYQPREFAKFGFDIEDRMKRGLEVWEVVEQALGGGVIDFEGAHVRIRDAALSIAPRQKKIRRFAVGNAPEFRRRIVETGAVPMCTPAIGPMEIVATTRRLLDETRREMGLPGDRFELAVQRYVFIAETRREAHQAAEQVLEHARLAMNMRRSEPLMSGPALEAPPFENEPDVETILARALIGGSNEIAERIVAEAAEYGVTHLSVFMQFASLPYARALRSMERFCEGVLPAVRSAVGRPA